jgi:hypothetical protein
MGRAQPLRSLLDRELDTLAFSQRAEPVSFDGRKVHKDIISAIAGYETVPFGIVEPLDGSNFLPLSALIA